MVIQLDDGAGAVSDDMFPKAGIGKRAPSQLFSLDLARIPDQADYYARTYTFAKWPKKKDIKPQDLIESGFFYTKMSDRVQCFHCGELLENWRPGDDVDKEHLKISPKCTFVKRKLGMIQGEHSVHVTGDKFTPVMERRVGSAPFSSSSIYGHNYGRASLSSQSVPTKRYPVAPRDIRARLDTESSRSLLGMGYKKQLLAQVVGERLAETGDDFPSFMEYFLAVTNAEQILSDGKEDTMKNYYDKCVDRLAKPITLIQGEGETKNKAANPAIQHDTSDKADQESSVRRQKECNICMDAEANIVFMPCRHMCACANCADMLPHCPICRKPIENLIKVFV